MSSTNVFEDEILNESAFSLGNVKQNITHCAPLIDTDTGEIINATFVSCNNEFVTFFIDINKKQNGNDASYIRMGITRMFELAEIENISDITLYAKKHGPLFGASFCTNLVIQEPVSSWLCASRIAKYALYIKALADEEKWDYLNKIASLNSYKLLGGAKDESIHELSSTFKLEGMRAYFNSIDNADHSEKRVWNQNKICETKTIWKHMRVSAIDQLIDKTEIEIFIATPNHERVLQIGRNQHETSLYEEVENPELEDSTIKELLSILLEHLISIHTGQANLEWKEGELKLALVPQ